MEEKKNETLSNLETTGKNLKPFNLEAAKTGKPVCTRDGRKARIICFDLNNKTYPIAAAVENDGEETEVHNFTVDGLATYGTLNHTDLMMVPEKHEGWVNVYKSSNGKRSIGCFHPTKEIAMSKVDKSNDSYLTTTKIEWEE